MGQMREFRLITLAVVFDDECDRHACSQAKEVDMFFGKIFGFGRSEPRYIRRTRAYLQEARMAMLEHTIAAEHYQSSAQMYAERAARLEEELRAWEHGEQHAPVVPHHYGYATRPVHKAVAADAAPVSGVVRAA